MAHIFFGYTAAGHDLLHRASTLSHLRRLCGARGARASVWVSIPRVHVAAAVLPPLRTSPLTSNHVRAATSTTLLNVNYKTSSYLLVARTAELEVMARLQRRKQFERACTMCVSHPFLVLVLILIFLLGPRTRSCKPLLHLSPNSRYSTPLPLSAPLVMLPSRPLLRSSCCLPSGRPSYIIDHRYRERLLPPVFTPCISFLAAERPTTPLRPPLSCSVLVAHYWELVLNSTAPRLRFRFRHSLLLQ